jgi:hypothetical protein
MTETPPEQTTVIAVIAATLLLFVHSAAAQQALSPLHPCGHGHQPPCPPPPPPPPPPSPVPIAVNFNPAVPILPDDTAVGTLIGTISVTMSDGSQFNGRLGFAIPYNSDGGICAISGSTVILGAALPTGPATANCTITATQ